MAEVQKPVDVVPVDVVQDQVVVAPAPALDTVVAEDKPTEEVKPTEAATETEVAKTEEPKEEVKPVEEGHLGHKAQNSSFPKNLIASKEFFFFGSEAFETKALEAYKKSEKHAETALNNIAWAAHTGKGLLFAGDKKAPSHVINLAHATEPETDGANKFHLTAHGSKHTFKAANTAERDNWVSQLKAKIAEAKELATSVTESETYKQTLESFKPAPKEEVKPEEAVVVDEPAKEETEAVKEEPKVEEPKRRSASRKRASFFGFGKKDTVPKDDAPAEETPAEATPAAPVAAEEAPVEAVVPATEAAPVEETPVTDAAATEEKAVESPKEKPANTKRNSFFGGVFSKKEKKAADSKPAEGAEATKDGETAPAETAPVIPPVEATTLLADDVNNAATPEIKETPAEAAPENKTAIKEKRKSSLPFAFGKRDKSPAPVDGEEKPNKSPFSKLRDTIKGKSGASKTEQKPAEEPAKTEEPVKEDEATEAVAVAEPAALQEPAATEIENKPENVTSSTPVVTAAA